MMALDRGYKMPYVAESPSNEVVPIRKVDELLATLPQDLVANFGFFQNVGSKALVACRLPAETNPIADLSKREYEVAIMVSHGFKYQSIASDLWIKRATARTHLHNIYKKLGTSDKFETSTYFPLDYDDLRGLPLYRLLDRELEVLEAIGSNSTIKQAAHELHITHSTIRTHKKKITDKLGFRADGEAAGFKFRRLAGAMTTIRHHQDLLDGINGTDIQTRIGTIIEGSAGAANIGKLGQLNSDEVYTAHNMQLVTDLEGYGFVPEGTKRHGKLALDGLVSAMLIKNGDIRPFMTNKMSAPLVKTIIDHEVSLFLASSDEAHVTQQAA
jgi:DNA-binding NarL/FixJ family response regulator